MELCAEKNEPEPKLRRRARRWLILLLLFAILGWFGRFAYLRIVRHPTPRPEYWAARIAELSPPLPPHAFYAKYANTVLTWRPFEDEFTTAQLPRSADFIVSTPGRFDPQNLLLTPWDERQPAMFLAGRIFRSWSFRLWRQGMMNMAEAGWTDDPLSLGIYMFFDDGLSAEYRACSAWMEGHARWSLASGNGRVASDDWLAILRIAQQFRRSPSIFRVLRRTGIQLDLGAEMVEAGRGRLAGFDIRSLASEMDAILDSMPSAHELLEGCRLETLCRLEFWYVREGGDWLDVCSWVRSWGTTPSGGVLSPLWNLTSPVFHSRTRAQAQVNRFFAGMAHCRSLSAVYQVLPAEGPSILDGMDQGILAPRLLEFEYAGRCLLEAGISMIALEQYRDREGRYPDSLNQLVPDFLPRLPIDYADLEPLRYRRQDKEYILYSVGSDGIDGGGAGGPAQNYRGWQAFFCDTCPDVVFSRIEQEASDESAGDDAQP